MPVIAKECPFLRKFRWYHGICLFRPERLAQGVFYLRSVLLCLTQKSFLTKKIVGFDGTKVYLYICCVAVCEGRVICGTSEGFHLEKVFEDIYED